MFEESTQTLSAVQDGLSLLKRKYTHAKGADALTAAKGAAASGVHALQIAVKSSGGAYMYPVKGIVYMAQTRDIWKPILSSLLFLGGASLVVLIALFIFTYVPQLAILAFVTGPFAPLVAFFLVLAEAWLVVSVLAKIGWMDPLQDDLFDAVLIENGLENLVAHKRDVRPGRARTVFARLGKKVQSTVNRFSLEAMIQYLITLPLNFIPVVGSVVFLVINGSKTAKSLHGRYFELKGFTPEQRDKFVAERHGAYMGFGVTALALSMIPVVGTVCAFSNTVGAALCACDIEKASTRGAAGNGVAPAHPDAFKVANEEARKEWRVVEQQ
ncbi:hypothetical protein HK104_000178 [Borealophlyctis nickersoniae]|nr:hypothetical protein HK104_000178 [Borealophlyctis nickersoniae]